MAGDGTNEPKTVFGRVAVGLAVALTGLGTGLAGLSSGQMESAMYWRSLAAQDQARAASQWTLAGFKKTRAVAVGSGARTLRAVGRGAPPTAPDKFRAAAQLVLAGVPQPVAAPLRAELDALLAAPDVQRLFRLMAGELPPAQLPEIKDEALGALLAALRAKKSDTELRALAVPVGREAATGAVRELELYADAYDRDLQPVFDAQGRLERFVRALDAAAADTVDDPGAPAPPHVRTASALLAGTQAGVDALDERVYEQETRISQAAGNLYEARVMVSDVAADRFRVKSVYLFYALILVQAAAALAAVGATRRPVLVLALLIGLAGATFAGYSYLSADPTIRGLS